MTLIRDEHAYALHQFYIAFTIRYHHSESFRVSLGPDLRRAFARVREFAKCPDSQSVPGAPDPADPT